MASSELSEPVFFVNFSSEHLPVNIPAELKNEFILFIKLFAIITLPPSIKCTLSFQHFFFVDCSIVQKIKAMFCALIEQKLIKFPIYLV